MSSNRNGFGGPRIPREEEPRAKIVHLTSVHPAFDTRIFHRECKTLAAAGYDVVLIAPHDQEVAQEGVTIRPVPIPKGRLSRMLKTAAQVFLAALRERADVYHFHDPELIPAALLLKLCGKKLVADVHEDVPGNILIKFWLPRWVRRPVGWLVGSLEGLAAIFMDGVIVATPAIARRFSAGKALIVRNYPILDEWKSVTVTPYAERLPRVVYVGKIEGVRGPAEMVEAIRLVDDVPGVGLALAGDFAPAELENELRSLPGWERVENMGFLSRSDVGRLLGRSRVGLVLLHPAPNHTEAQPNKLFEYMAAGLPVVASDFPLWRELIEGLGCGLVVNPQNPKEIAGAISTLLEDPARARAMGRRGREAVAAKYNWNIEARHFLDLYEQVTHTRRGLGPIPFS